MILFIIVGATTFAQILSFSGASNGLSQAITGAGLAPWAVIAAMMLMLIFLGIFVDQVSMMMITLPIFMPVVQALGVDLVWFGVLFLICMQMGLLLPPHGLLLMTMKGVAPPSVTMLDIFRAVVPFLVDERAAARARLPRAGGRDLAAGADRLSAARTRRRRATGSDRHAAIDAERLPGRELRLVAGEVDDHRRDLLGLREPAHRLAVDERLARRDRIGVGVDAPGERRRVDRPRAERVAADALLDVVGGDALGQADHRRLGEAVDAAVRRAP